MEPFQAILLRVYAFIQNSYSGDVNLAIYLFHNNILVIQLQDLGYGLISKRSKPGCLDINCSNRNLICSPNGWYVNYIFVDK